MVRPNEQEVLIEGNLHANEQLKNHEEIRAFYRGNISRKKLAELEESGCPIQKEAKFLSKHADLRQHMLIFQR